MKSFEAHGMAKDLEKVRQFSNLVRKRILESDPKYEGKIANLSQEELEDLDTVLALAEQTLLKYHHKKEASVLLREFVDLIRNWSGSLVEINDEIQELIISAQSSVSEIKTAQSDVSTNFSFSDQKQETTSQAKKDGTINLTKSAIPVYTQGYQQNHEAQCEQVT